MRAIERQLPDALELVARALRAGHALSSALEMVATEAPQPIAREFQLAFHEATYGVPMQEALVNLANRVALTDLRFFVIAVGIQRETGGNLAELLDKLSALIRERFQLLGTVRVLATEGRMSAWILTILPFVLLFAMHFVNPRFMSILWKDPAGLTAIYIGITLMVTGIIWMWRTVRIRV